MTAPAVRLSVLRLSALVPQLGPEDPDWLLGAACRGMNTELFFPGPGRGHAALARDAKAVCAACPVRTECLQYAVDHGIRGGIWGGLADRERIPLHKARLVELRRQRDQAIVVAIAAGYPRPVIAHVFGVRVRTVNSFGPAARRAS